MAWTVNGNVYTADPNDTTPGRRHLDSDGHRVNFPLLCDDMLAVASDASDAADAAAADADLVAADKATVAADKGTVATDKGIVAADKATTQGYRDTAQTHAGTATTKAAEAAASALAAAGSASAAASEADAADAAATAAQGYRDTAQGHAATASSKAAEAAASAASAVSAPGTNATSTTSLTIGTGGKSLTIQTGKALVVGMSVKVANTAAPGNWMAGDVTAYDAGTGALTVNSLQTNGSGTFSAWTVSLTAPVTASSGAVSLGANTFTDDQTILAPGGNGLLLNTVASGSTPEISTLGADTDIGISVAAKGAGAVSLRTAATAEQLRVSHTANAVVYVQVTGAATGGAPALSAQGSDTNISLTVSAKGSGVLSFRTGGTVEQFRVGHTANAVNFLLATGSATGNALDLAATGSDANIGLTLSAKGTGTLTFRTGGTVGQLEVTHTAAAANRIRVTGGAAGNPAVMSAVGSDTDVTLALASQAAGAVSLRTNGSVEQFRVAHVANAANYPQVAGAAAGASPAISVQGSDTNIGLTISAKGTGVIDFRTGATIVQLRVAHVANAANFLEASGAATGGAPGLAAKGSDTNVALTLSSQGTGNVQLRTNGSVVQLEAAHVANAANYGRVAGGATGAGVTFSAQGADTNVDLALMAKGTGGIGLNVADPLPNTIDTDGAIVGNIVAMAASDMDLSAGEYFTKTINGAFSPTFSNIPASRAVTWRLKLTHTSGAITWPAAVIWSDGTLPSLTTGKVHLFFFSTDDGGTTVRASALKNYAS